MKYNDFIKAVKEKLSTMSEEDKTKWIYNNARIAKENERCKILNSLEGRIDYNPIIYEKDKIKEWCKKIEEGEIYFECSGYEDYSQGYWTSDYVYDYYDPFGIVKDLYNSFKMAEDRLYQKQYQESKGLNNLLLNLIFIVSDKDTGHCNEFDFEEVVDEIWANFNYERIILNLMYATYQIKKGKDRAKSLYEYLKWDKAKNIKTEDMFSIGPEELKNIDTFIEEWISFLINMDSDRAAELLLEACLYKGIDYLCEIARTECMKHPVLFKYACQELLNQNRDTECEKLGLEAIEALPENLVIRGEIADLTAKAATKLNHHDIVNSCYEAAFYSESTLNNYFRLFQIPNHENITKKVANYIKGLPEDTIYGLGNENKQMMVNTLSKNNKDVIRFFNGEFDYIYDTYIKEEYSLGWTTGFKGVIIPLFILLLNKDKKTTKAIMKLVEGIIYRLGFVGEDVEFLELFFNWVEKQSLTEAQYKKYISWLEDEIDKRTEGVVGGGYRNSYYKAAILVASFGEALESNGIANGRSRTIEHYRKLHSRKRAFKTELELLND